MIYTAWGLLANPAFRLRCQSATTPIEASVLEALIQIHELGLPPRPLLATVCGRVGQPGLHYEGSWGSASCLLPSLATRHEPIHIIGRYTQARVDMFVGSFRVKSCGGSVQRLSSWRCDLATNDCKTACVPLHCSWRLFGERLADCRVKQKHAVVVVTICPAWSVGRCCTRCLIVSVFGPKHLPPTSTGCYLALPSFGHQRDRHAHGGCLGSGQHIVGCLKSIFNRCVA